MRHCSSEQLPNNINTLNIIESPKQWENPTSFYGQTKSVLWGSGKKVIENWCCICVAIKLQNISEGPLPTCNNYYKNQRISTLYLGGKVCMGFKTLVTMVLTGQRVSQEVINQKVQ